MTPDDALAQFEIALLAIWRSQEGDSAPGFGLLPLFGQWPSRKTPIVLFLGLSPSFVPSALEEHWAATHHQTPELLAIGLDALNWVVPENADGWGQYREAVEQLDRYSREEYKRYYGPVDKLMADTQADVHHEHLDLFPLRSTDQGAFKEFLAATEDSNRAKWKAREELLNAALDLVRAMAPKVIVVVNAAASRLVRDELGLELQTNGHRYASLAWPGVTFLLGSQLSGGATSEFARERLVADLRDVLQGGQGLMARPS
ncbi:hypothetical protein [Roseateles cavernae]|uniref:hypothetical protein n=1 Tax=Roseateles cavernae TaxID=3153578 RepID=UPI0032E4AB9B